MSTTRSKSKKGSRSRRSRKAKSGNLFGSLLEMLCLTFLGKVLLTGLVLAIILAFNILVTQNQFDRFFLFLGIELFIIAGFFWIKFLLKK